MAQKLARHSKPSLTANAYTHLDLNAAAEAVGKLPSIPFLNAEPTNEKPDAADCGSVFER